MSPEKFETEFKSYDSKCWNIFAGELANVLLESGFEFLSQPYYDDISGRYHASYLRRYLFQRPTKFNDEMILETHVDFIGIPVGYRGLIIYAREKKNQNIFDGENYQKLRLNFDSSENQSSPSSSYDNSDNESKSNMSQWSRLSDLQSFVSRVIEMVSPGLIELPVELKLEILKRLNAESILKMAQVNHEFYDLIYQHGDPLWRHLCKRDFNCNIICRGIHRTWLDLYKALHKQYIYELIKNSRALPPAPILPALPPVPARLSIAWLPIAPLALLAPFELPVAHGVLPMPPIRRASLESLNRLIVE